MGCEGSRVRPGVRLLIEINHRDKSSLLMRRDWGFACVLTHFIPITTLE